MTSAVSPLMMIIVFEATLNKFRKPNIVSKAHTSNKTTPIIFSTSSRKSSTLSSLFYYYFNNHILIQLNTISSILRIHLVYTAARGCAKLTCGISFCIHTCFVISKERLDHSCPQVTLFYGVMMR